MTIGIVQTKILIQMHRLALYAVQNNIQEIIQQMREAEILDILEDLSNDDISEAHDFRFDPNLILLSDLSLF